MLCLDKFTGEHNDNRGCAPRKITPVISPKYNRVYTETEVNIL